MEAIQIKVFGKVQGVWYRKSTQLKAVELGIRGTVQNRLDGSVYIEAEGNPKQLQELINWCHIGPTHAEVERVGITQGTWKGLERFEVIR